MKKIIVVVGVLLMMISTASAACSPETGVCDASCGDPTTYTTPAEDWYFDEEYACWDDGGAPKTIVYMSSVGCKLANQFIETGVWDSMTTDCINIYSSVCTDRNDIVCPSYEYLGRQVEKTDCSCWLTQSGFCPWPGVTQRFYGWCAGTEDFSSFDFADPFFAGSGSGGGCNTDTCDNSSCSGIFTITPSGTWTRHTDAWSAYCDRSGNDLVFNATGCASTVSMWENMTTECVESYNFSYPPDDWDSLCPQYEFLDRPIVGSDCVCYNNSLGDYLQCTGSEPRLSQYNFSDPFFAGSGGSGQVFGGSGNYNVTVTVRSDPPSVFHINMAANSTPGIAPRQATITTAYAQFVAKDVNGYADMNTTSASCDLYSTGSGDRQYSGLCEKEIIDYPPYGNPDEAVTVALFTCPIDMNYYNNQGCYILGCGVSDMGRGHDYMSSSESECIFTYYGLTGISITPGSINFAELSIGSVAAADNPITVHNEGNVEITNVSMKAYDLENLHSDVFSCANFNVTTSAIPGTGAPVVQDTYVQVPGMSVLIAQNASAPAYVMVYVPSGSAGGSYHSTFDWVVGVNP